MPFKIDVFNKELLSNQPDYKTINLVTSGDLTFLSVSGSWNSVYNTVNSLSSNWSSVYTNVSIISSEWDSAYNIVNSLSSEWDSTYNTVNSLSSNWNNAIQTLVFTPSSSELTISNGNTISLSSLQSNYVYTNISQNVLSNRKYAFDTLTQILTATLPSNPNVGDEIEFFDITGKWVVNNLVVFNNGNNIEQRNEKLECNVRFGCFKLIYVGATDSIGWRIIPLPRHSVFSIAVPSIDITASVYQGLIPLSVNFNGINLLSNIISPVETWSWNLTSGNTADYTTQNTSYTYNTSGNYIVSLTGSNTVGSDTTSIIISAVQPLIPVPFITTNLTNLSGFIPLTATFVASNALPASSSYVNNWYWNLTGGDTADYTTQSVTYVYETSGTYNVNLTASNITGFNTTSVTVTASPIPGDPYFSNVSILMNMDSDFSDQSLNNYSFNEFGTPSINTSIKKFGAGSGYFDSSGDYLTSSTSNLFGFGTGDFTIEAWIYPTGTNSFQGLFCVGDYITGILIRWHANAVTDSCYINSTVYNWFPATNAPVNNWTHIALVRQSGNIKFFAGGIDRLVGSPVNNSNLGSTGVPLIGASSHSTSEGFNGYIDELRVTKGIARYTSTFTPPTAPFKNY